MSILMLLCLSFLTEDGTKNSDIKVSYTVGVAKSMVEIAIANHSNQQYEYCSKGRALQFVLRQRRDSQSEWRITHWNRSGTGVDVVNIRPKEMHVWKVDLKNLDLGESADFQFGVIAQPKGATGSDQENFRWGNSIDWTEEI